MLEVVVVAVKITVAAIVSELIVKVGDVVAGELVVALVRPK